MSKLFLLLAATCIFSIVSQPLVFAQGNDVAPFCATDTSLRGSESTLRSLESFSEAFQVSQVLIYLDMDGATVRAGFDSGDTYTSSIISGTRSLPAPALTDAQKAEIVRLVADDFSPFNITVTTDFSLFAQTPAISKQICIVTTFPSVAGFSSGTGGVSPFVGIGHRLPNAPVFAFSAVYDNHPADVALVVSHEIGHALGGLPHQHRYDTNCSITEEYHSGFGVGPLSFDPLMAGNRLLHFDGITNWFGQTCAEPLFGAPVYDFQFLNDQVVLRADDFPDDPNGDALPSTGEIDGILGRPFDVDYIRINFKNPGPVTVTSDNIDIKVSVVTASGKVLDEYNDPTGLDVVIPKVNGMRFLKIEGASNDNLSAEFMTGQYHISY